MSKKFRILVVDDESAFCELCSDWLTKQGYEVVTSGTPENAALTFKAQQFDLVLLDLALPPSFMPEEGLNLLSLFSGIPVIVMTGHAERALALKAIGLGAWDFLSKPLDPDLLLVVVKRALEKHKIQQELSQLKSVLALQKNDCGLIGISQNIRQLRELIQRIAPTEVSVLINGPSGTGKELIAQAVHQLSQRQHQPFICVHCGAIPATLMESELFGYKRGAFTGADSDKKGLLALADGGSLFLDEIGEMPLSMQVKLLRVLQEGCYYPVGGRALETINCRIISATHRPLEQMMKEGLFREDFYYRIKGLTLQTQSLAQRKDDIAVLLNAFLTTINQSLPKPKSLSDEALHWFMSQPWPGNVRELRNALQSIAAISRVNDISLEDIGLLYVVNPEQVSTASGQGTLDQQVQALEIQLIQQALHQCQGNKSQSAQKLGLSRQGLLNKMQRYGIDGKSEG
ncbi:MAG: two-component system response regulator AtoC [Phenylobacterium sp.]|jgi:two-component system response regulator AtoC